MRAFRATVLAACWVVLVLAAEARAKAQSEAPAARPERVVLLQPHTAPARPGLEPSLRIQLRGLTVLALAIEFPPDLPSRLQVASEIAREHAADWVVWTEDVQTDSDAASSQAVLYVVGRRDGRALIEVVRVPGGEGPEVDRSLALKVRELIGMDDSAAFALGVREIATEQATKRSVTFWVELGAQLSSEGSAGLAPDVFIALGPSLVTEAFVFAVPIELGYGFARSAERTGDRVAWTELSAAVWLKLLARVHPLLLIGGGLGGELSFTDADGVARSGRRGTATERLPAALLSADAELQLSPSLGARFALGLEQRAQRQRFVIENRQVADTGRTVPYARLSLVWHPW